MKNTFLIGRFLQGYAPAYRYKSRPTSEQHGLSQENLKASFARRSLRLRRLRKQHGLRLQLSGGATLLLLVLAFNLDIQPRVAGSLESLTQESVVVTEIIQTRQLVKPPPPPRPPVPVVVPDDEILQDDDLDLDASLDIGAPLVAAGPPPPAEEPVDDEPEREFFVVVEEMPEMVGGMAALSKDLVYPMAARRAGIEGMVVVQVLVDATGTPSRPEVTKAVHTILDEAAVEAVLKQRFKPGRQRGKAVPVMMAIPVRFRFMESV